MLSSLAYHLTKCKLFIYQSHDFEVGFYVVSSARLCGWKISLLPVNFFADFFGNFSFIWCYTISSPYY